jgi:serine/threonine protein kinase
MIIAITKKGKINIDPSKEISQGGEGAVYEVDSNTVAKIYHPGIKPISEQKLQFLSKLDQNYFVSPIELLYNSKGDVIGYTMKYIDQSFFPLSNLFTLKFCKNNGIDKKLKMKIIERLIAAVKYAHQENVVIGDLNPFNVLVNSSGVIKLIDTDSYETPGFPHSHILLDDIRDYYYQGRVSKDSDFFALSILSFNLLAFLHPFKGMHKMYKKISDRMIHKLPVFINDPDIIIPKCYEPIQDTNFMDQFKKMYLKGERFLLSLTGIDGSIIATSPLAKPSLVKKYEQDELIITMVNKDSDVSNVFFLEKQGVVETATEYIIYDSSNKGYLTLKSRISKSEYEKVFVGNENILLKKGNELWRWDNGKVELMKNFKFPPVHIITQMEDILIVIGPDDMYKLFIDRIGAGTVMTEHIGVYGKGFSNHNGFIHNSAGKQNIFYNSGQNISIVQSPVEFLNGVYQDKNVGIIQYVDKKKIRIKMFKIEGLKIKISDRDFDSMSNFAFMPNIDSRGKREKDGMIFMPVDDRIEIYRTNDFEKISEMRCSLVSSQSVLYKSNAGIIVWDGNEVALLNKK